MEYTYRRQSKPDSLIAYSDSDWAGCRRTRRSTSGGVILHGAHLVQHWSRTQSVVALSSAEAELNALLKTGSEILGAAEFTREIGMTLNPVIRGDSTAAQAILARRGSGKVKHLEAKQMWLQEVVRQGRLCLEKVPRNQNPADALTHHGTRASLDSASKMLDISPVTVRV